MAIVTISRGSFSKGKEIAQRVAEKLGYECLSREVLLEASTEFNIPEIKLIRAIHDAPSILERLGYKKERYIAFIQAAFLQHLRKDNVVYAGLAGHFIVKDIPHVLKVRVIADLDERVKNEVAREGITRTEALHIIQRDDEERRKWSEHLYGINTSDPSLYDLLIHTGKMTIDDAVGVICHTVQFDTFRTTPESQQTIEDIALAAQVRAALIDIRSDIDVVASRGLVQVHTAALLVEREDLIKDIEAVAKSIEGVREVRVGVKPKDY